MRNPIEAAKSFSRKLQASSAVFKPYSPQREAILGRAAEKVKESLRTRVGENRAVAWWKRFSRAKKGKNKGKVLAVYYRGNLRRSVKVLDLRNTPNKYVGPVYSRTKGFRSYSSETSADGYYFMWYEKRYAPLRRTAITERPKIISKLKKEFKAEVNRIWKS